MIQRAFWYPAFLLVTPVDAAATVLCVIQVDAQLADEVLRQEVAEQLAAAAAASKLQLAELAGQLDSQGAQLRAQLQDAQQAMAADQEALATKVGCQRYCRAEAMATSVMLPHDCQHLLFECNHC